MADTSFKAKSPETRQEERPDQESLLTKEQHKTFETLLAAQDEISQFKFQAEYCLKRLHKKNCGRGEIWQTAEFLKMPMARTRECLDQAKSTPTVLSPVEARVSVPATLLSRLKNPEAKSHESDSENVDLTPEDLCRVIIKNLKRLKKSYTNSMEVWDQSLST